MKCWRLCREIDRVLSAIRTCFVYVLWNFSGFPWVGSMFCSRALKLSGTLWSAKRPTLKFVVLQTALTPRWFGKGDRWGVDFQYFDEFKVIFLLFFRCQASLGFANVCVSSQYLYHTDFALFTVTQLVRKTPRNITIKLVTSFTDINSANDGAF